MTSAPADPHASRHVIPLREATKAWGLVALQTFGGPAGQIAVMQRTLVDERRWLGEKRFLHALSYCMLLPGPEAQQLAIYTGWLLNGWVGGLIAGILFVLPGVVALLGLSWLYAAHGDATLVAGVFAGLAPAVLAIVLQAVLRVGGRALATRFLVGMAVAAFVALAAFGVPFPLVVLGAGVVGWLVHRRRPDLVVGGGHKASGNDGPAPLIPDDALHHAAPSWRRNLAIVVGGAVIWAVPVALAAAIFGRHSIYVDEGLFFGGTALVTFGGAYAVLAFVAQKAVESYGWLSGTDMVKGLALAETTPGPLIMVVQYVAFLGAWHSPGDLAPWQAALIASLLTTWVTFVPCFLFIFLGAPYVERLRGNAALSAALTGITAAVVGVIANLAIYFAVHTLFERTRTVASGPLHLLVPVWSSFAWQPAAIAVVALLLAFRLKWSVLRTLGVCAVLGLALQLT
ncbi:chromate efflux transporter [Nocardioides jejuensis]|uniref:Chromate efflux transporter n=1 Tax=Nocardioides jejuensis TaxID=2502782 RepID=A0A4R1CH43_9ACTN|nr:chromate efflux transporter [Nocardioides jejuensis]TCJ30057.1 chromate efflux transporter [Nocardioides jejuensis]